MPVKLQIPLFIIILLIVIVGGVFLFTNVQSADAATIMCDNGCIGWFDYLGICNRIEWSCNDLNACSSVNACQSFTQQAICGGADYSCGLDSALSYSTDDGCTSLCVSGQCSGGSCVTPEPVCDTKAGTPCTKSSSCETRFGTYECNGITCNAPEPSQPANYDATCTRSNACGQINTGSIMCNEQCSVSAPSLPSGYGNSCSECNNVGECNLGTIGCAGCSASAPAGRTISVSASAPSSVYTGQNVNVTASVGGSATGSIDYRLDCDNNSIYESGIETSSSTTHTFTYKCSYNTAGTKTIKVRADRQGLNDTATTSVSILVDSAPTVTISANKSQYAPGETIDITVTGSDDRDISTLQAYYGGSWHSQTCAGIQTACTHTFSTSQSTTGTYTYTGNAWDNTGQGAVPKITTIEVRDTTGPSIGELTPTIATTSGSTSFSASVSDAGSGVASCNLYISKPIETSFSDAGSMTLSQSPCPAGASCTASGTYTFGSIASGTYQAYARCTDGNGTSGSGAITNIEVVSALSAPPPDAFSVGASCNLTLTTRGWDVSDSSSVRYRLINNDTDFREVRMDDNVNDGWNDNLSILNTWNVSGNRISITTTGDRMGTTTHNLASGFELNVSDFVTDANCRLSLPNPPPCLDSTSLDPTGISRKMVTNDGTATDQYDIAYCGDGTKSCWETCEPGVDQGCEADCTWETTPPTSMITRVEDDSSLPGFRPNFPNEGDYSAFLNADDRGYTKKTWWIYVQDSDNAGGSGLKTCHIAINGTEKPPRVCTGWTSFTVGKSSTGADCTDQGNDKCKVRVWAKDNAGNVTTRKNVNDPTLNENEKAYIDGVVTQDANEFTFGVDWTPPLIVP